MEKNDKQQTHEEYVEEISKISNEQISEIQENEEQNIDRLKQEIEQQEVDLEREIRSEEFEFEYFNKNNFLKTFASRLKANRDAFMDNDCSTRQRQFIRIASHEPDDSYDLNLKHSQVETLLDDIIDSNDDDVIIIDSITVEVLVNVLRGLRTMLTKQIILFTTDEYKKHIPQNDFKNMIILKAGE